MATRVTKLKINGASPRLTPTPNKACSASSATT